MNRAFSRQKDHRELMLRNLATSLVLYERIDTTMPKAKELKSFIDHILAGSKKDDLTTIRNLNKVFLDKNAVKKVVEVLIPRYAERSSGFTRTFGLKNRAGDNAAMMRIELVDKKIFIEEKKDPVENTLKSPNTPTKKTEKVTPPNLPLERKGTNAK